MKPSNLMLDRDGKLRLVDFGLARTEGDASLTASGDLVGTPLYMSPEQARVRKVRIDHHIDVYSLGATLYEAVTLRPPFRGKSHQDTLSQIETRDPAPPRSLNAFVPQDLETIILKCLRKDPSDRYGTAEAMAQDLSRFVRCDAIEARPRRPSPSSTAASTRPRTGLPALTTRCVAEDMLARGTVSSGFESPARLRSDTSSRTRRTGVRSHRASIAPHRAL